MATNRGLTGWRRREAAKDAEERRAAREAIRVSSSAKDQLAFWRDQPDLPLLGFVYFVVEYSDAIDAVKIGYAVDPLIRASQLQTGNPRPLQLAQVLYGTPTSEGGYHELWKRNRVRGEWFGPATEILDWASWAAETQREQLALGLDDFRVRSTHGKHPKDWHSKEAA